MSVHTLRTHNKGLSERVVGTQEVGKPLEPFSASHWTRRGIVVAEGALRNLAKQVELDACDHVAAEAELVQTLNSSARANLPVNKQRR